MSPFERGLAGRTDLTSVLHRAEEGDREAEDRLFRWILPSVKQFASRQKSCYSSTQWTTEIVDEVYRVFHGSDPHHFKNRNRFFAWASRVVRSVIIDHLRRRKSVKRGGQATHEDLVVAVELTEDRGILPAIDLLALDEALQELDDLNRDYALIADAKFFGGLTHRELAESLGLSVDVIKDRLRFIRAFLASRLQPC